jgi:hypothetical protein
MAARLLADWNGAVLKELDGVTGSADQTPPADFINSAKAFMQQARAQSQKTFWYDVTAPVVVFYALLFTPRSANSLPTWASKWDNNVSINGDGTAYKGDDGVWVQLGGAPAPEGKTVVSYDDPAYDGDAYYAAGFSPRSFWARYVWCGWRNRASQLAADLGVVVSARPVCIAGDVSVGRSNPGYKLLQATDDAGLALYHYKSFRNVGPLCMVRSYGAKLEYAYYWPQDRFADTPDQRNVPYVTIGVSFKAKG